MNDQLRTQLREYFVNCRGQLCDNLSTSRSKLADLVRQNRREIVDKSAVRNELIYLRRKIEEIDRYVGGLEKMKSRKKVLARRANMRKRITNLKKLL